MITMFRGSFIPIVFNQSLRLSNEAFDESTAVTMMSTDVDKISNSLEIIHEIWANVIEIAIGLWLLEMQLGWVCVAPCVVAACRS